MCFTTERCWIEAGDSVARLIYGKFSIARGFIGHVTYVSLYPFFVMSFFVCMCTIIPRHVLCVEDVLVKMPV